MIDKEFISTLKNKLNIVDVVGSYCSLEKKGGNYWACCPFHHEKTPSFAVNESEQFYHCFGCGESGDIIGFVKAMENIDYVETIRLLADRAKLQVPEGDFDSEKTQQLKRKRDTLLRLMKDVAHFYLDNLNGGNAEKHIEYILERQIPAKIVRTFGLGASLDFNSLPRYLAQKGYSKQDMLDSGTVQEVQGRLTDAQGGRLIYPIINNMDEVVAFGGRLLEKKPSFAKYKNTKETIIFNKSKTLYNINQLKKLKHEQAIKQVIMVEGYMDTISLFQAGFRNVVASMGTSLTQEQARLIHRYTDTVLISYDGDGAGQKANMRGLDILKDEGLNVKVVPLPEGLDPDDVIKQRGAEGYQKCLDAAMPLIDFKLLYLKKGYDLTKPEEKRKYVSEAIKIIRTGDGAAEKEDLLKMLRDETGVTFEALNRELLAEPAQDTKQEAAPVVRQDASTMHCKASRYVLAAYLFGAKFAQDGIEEIDFCHDVHKVVARYVLAKKLLDEPVHVSDLFDLFEEGSKDAEEFSRVLDLNDGDHFTGEIAERYFNDCVYKLRVLTIDEQIANLKTQIAKSTNVEERLQLTQEIQSLLQAKVKLQRSI